MDGRNVTQEKRVAFRRFLTKGANVELEFFKKGDEGEPGSVKLICDDDDEAVALVESP